MKFSVIIPVYNGWEYLREGVDSVLGQTGADFEILLVDDGSTDGESGALCDTLAREHPDCIRVLHKPNGGAGDARNAALPLAQGDYVLFLDSDDSYTPEAFAVLAAALDETQADVCYFGLRMTGDNDGTVFTDDLPLHTPLTLAETPALLLNRPSACIAACSRSTKTSSASSAWTTYSMMRPCASSRRRARTRCCRSCWTLPPRASPTTGTTPI